MIGAHVKHLPTFREVLSPVRDEETGQFERHPIREWIDGIRTPVHYNGPKDEAVESWAWIRGVDEKLAGILTEYPDVVALWTPEQTFGYRRQARDDDGNLMWTGEGEDREPVMETVSKVQEAWDAYARCYDMSSYDVTDEDGTRIVYPPVLGYRINNQRFDHLLLEREDHGL